MNLENSELNKRIEKLEKRLEIEITDELINTMDGNKELMSIKEKKAALFFLELSFGWGKIVFFVKIVIKN